MLKHQEAFEALVTTVAEYESDTFSASARKLTREQARAIADDLAFEALTDLVELDTLDGVMVTEVYERLYEDDSE